MVLKLVGLSLVLLLCSCNGSIEDYASKETNTYIKGVNFYEQRCVICHGTDGKLRVSDAKDLTKSTLSIVQMEEVIKNGKGAMPAFGHTIESDSTLNELIEHLIILRK